MLESVPMEMVHGLPFRACARKRRSMVNIDLKRIIKDKVFVRMLLRSQFL